MIGCGGEPSQPAEPPAEPRAAPPATPLRPPEPPDPAVPPASCGDPARCHALGLDAERAGQHARAAELYEQACDRELGPACFRLGELLRDGRGVPPDDARAEEFFSRGCRYGSQSACDALGH